MKKTDKYIKREIFGENFLVPIGQTSNTVNGLIALNDVCSFIYDCLNEDISLDDLVKKITERYDIDRDVAEIDAKECIDGFAELGIAE